VFALFDINIKRFVDRSVWYITKDNKRNDQGAFVMTKRNRKNLGASVCGDCRSRWSSGRVENSQFITHGNQVLFALTEMTRMTVALSKQIPCSKR